jgi:NAD-dependent deacetylase
MAALQNTAPIEAIAELLAAARRLAVFTGAGMSAESGIPTFRDAQTGLWAQFDPEQLATAAAFEADKALVWGWYRSRMTLVERAQPNAGHLAIAALERMKPGLVVVTQNVDDLHERAGSSDVVHLHGSLFSPRCFACARPFAYDRPAVPDTREPATRADPPMCRHCNGPVRPGVVWFGEPLPEEAWSRAERLMAEGDAVVVVGTSGVVQPAASLPAIAKRHRKPIVEINPEPSALSPLADVAYRAKAADGLPSIVTAMQKRQEA